MKTYNPCAYIEPIEDKEELEQGWYDLKLRLDAITCSFCDREHDE